MNNILIQSNRNTFCIVNELNNIKVKEFIQKRNDMLISFFVEYVDSIFDFSHESVERITILGDPNRPVILFNNGFSISLYINNFKVSLRSDYDVENPETELLEIDLNYALKVIGTKASDKLRQNIQRVMKDVARREFHKVVNYEGLYYFDGGVAHPQFAKNVHPEYFFSYRTAKQFSDAINTLHGNCTLVVNQVENLKTF